MPTTDYWIVFFAFFFYFYYLNFLSGELSLYRMITLQLDASVNVQTVNFSARGFQLEVSFKVQIVNFQLKFSIEVQ